MIARRLSALFTLACALVLLAFIALVVSLHLAEPALESVTDPERALALIVERTMELSDALAHAPAWERRLYELTMTEGAGELAQAIEWYEELARRSLDPGVDFRLALLQAEAGQLRDVRQTVQAWERRGAPFDAYAALVTAAYLDGPLPAAGAEARALAELAPRGWFRIRVAERLATRTGDRAWLQSVHAEAAARMRRVLGRVRLLTASEAALLVGGLFAAVGLLKSSAARRMVAAGGPPPPWSMRQGLVVVIRGGAAGAVIGVALLYAWPGSSDSALVEALTIPLMNLPLLLLARRRLAPADSPSLVATLGLWPWAGGWRPLALTASVLVAAGIVIDLAVALAGESLGLSSHWTEWFESDMAWGSPAMVTASVAGAVLFAPIFEEIAFRGLLFGTLRRAAAWPVAAVISAAVFALAHGYGSLGFASVFLSGFLWAWAYEVTGSLLPGMIAHAVNNLFASASMLWLIRS